MELKRLCELELAKLDPDVLKILYFRLWGIPLGGPLPSQSVPLVQRVLEKLFPEESSGGSFRA